MKDNDVNAQVRAVKEMKRPDKPFFRPHSTNEILCYHYYHKHFNIMCHKKFACVIPVECDRNQWPMIDI